MTDNLQAKQQLRHEKASPTQHLAGETGTVTDSDAYTEVQKHADSEAAAAP